MALIDTIEKAQDQALETLTDSQKRILEINEKVADALKDRMTSVPMPLSSVLPTPTQGAKLYFDFAGNLLAANRKFVESVLKAWAAPAAKAAPKARAKVAA